MSETTTQELPTGWVTTTIGDVAEILRGVTYKKEDSSLKPGPGMMPILRATNIASQLSFEDLVYVPERDVSEEQLLRIGDIILAASSGSRAVVGKAAFLGIEWRGSFGAFCYAVRIHPMISPKLLAYFFQTSEYRHQVSDLSAGVNINNLRRHHIENISYRLPPRAEQQRLLAEIEKQITRLDAAVAALKRIQANVRRYRVAALKAACEGRLVPTEAELACREGRSYEHASELLKRILAERRARWEAVVRKQIRPRTVTAGNDELHIKYVEPASHNESDLAQLSEGWEWARAEQLCGFITKGTTPGASKLFANSGEVPYIKVYNLTHRGTLDFSVNPTFISRGTHEGELARSRVFPGDVLMNIVGPPLGKVSIVPSTHPEWNINQAIAIFRPMPSLNGKFLSYCLLTESILKWAVRRSKATAGQFNLTLEICRDLPLPVPPADEQRRIVNELERRLSILEELEMQTKLDLVRAERLHQAILKSAFEGKLVSHDPDDEPASILLERIRAEREGSQLLERPNSTRKRGAKAHVTK